MKVASLEMSEDLANSSFTGNNSDGTLGHIQEDLVNTYNFYAMNNYLSQSNWSELGRGQISYLQSNISM